MPKTFEPNEAFFRQILRSAPVEALVDAAAERALNTAQATAPEDTGDYKAGLRIEHKDASYRRVARVVGADEKTMLIESKTGNLARALKAAKR